MRERYEAVKKKKLFSLVLICAPALLSPAHGATWSRVRQKHRGCEHRLQRCERLQSELSAGVRRLKAFQRTGISGGRGQTDVESFLQTVSTRETSLMNRIDRLKRMGEKIVKDIESGSASGEGCPNCVVSSVDLYCRQIASVLSGLNELLAEMRKQKVALKRGRSASALISRNRTALDSLSGAFNNDGRADLELLDSTLAEQERAEAKLAGGDDEEALGLALSVYEAIEELRGGAGRQTDADFELRLRQVHRQCDTLDNPTALTLARKAQEHYGEYEQLKKSKKSAEAHNERAIARELLRQAEQALSGQ